MSGIRHKFAYGTVNREGSRIETGLEERDESLMEIEMEERNRGRKNGNRSKE